MLGISLSELCKWVSKKRRKVSWIVKRFGKYRRKVSWIVKRSVKYGRKVSWIVCSPAIWKEYWSMFSSYQKKALTVMMSPLCTNCHDITVILLNVELNTKYGRKASWIVIKLRKKSKLNSEKDLEIMEETQVE
jgi:hypothetical protein